MSADKYPFTIPPTVARHLHIALKEEIERPNAIGKTLGGWGNARAWRKSLSRVGFPTPPAYKIGG